MSAVAHIDQYKQGTFFTDEFRGDLSWNGYEYNVLLRNLGNDENGIPQFVDMAPALGADDQDDARGIAIFDYDNDGDLDIAINHNPGDNNRDEQGIPAVLLRNDIGNNSNWLSISLVGVTSNRDAIGAELVLEAGDLRLFRQVTAGSGYAGHSSKRVHFGLGDVGRVDRLTVRWPTGEEQSWQNLDTNRFITITEGEELQTIREARYGSSRDRGFE